eukprot:UN18625
MRKTQIEQLGEYISNSTSGVLALENDEKQDVCVLGDF